mmetsp:Transcript_40518/g.65862  ORF Transcript_40518/g.65862 Transcript_40518/m.65862 type:complete len:126 (-) Transcript_40518:251-628(-)|eukprot:jgi/Bigna1/63040/fgenesh1_kg.46_\
MGQTCLSNAGGEKITSSQFITEPRIIENSSWNADTTNLWVQYVDQHSGIPYFYNVYTSETSWEKPDVQYLIHPSVLDYIRADPVSPRKVLKHDQIKQDIENISQDNRPIQTVRKSALGHAQVKSL